MTAKLLTSIEQWGELLKRYQQKETLCNNYMMLAEMESLINGGSLSVLENNNNLFLLQKKEKCSRVYYYLNCMNESFDIDIENDLVVEIIFRQNKGLPEQELEFLSRCGFVMYKRRDQYSGSYKEMRLRSHATGIVVREATSIEEVKCSCELFNKVFDAYSGDYISDKDIHSLFEAKAIHVATDIKGLFLGALHQTIINNTAWISHLAVIDKARGKGVGKALLDSFVENNKREGKGRYMLWVQSKNATAKKMYQDKGFIPVGKSTLSMIKIKQTQ